MNFKLLICFILLIFVISCGVKSDPVIPPNSEIPGYEKQFLKTKNDLEKKDKKN